MSFVWATARCSVNVDRATPSSSATSVAFAPFGYSKHPLSWAVLIVSCCQSVRTSRPTMIGLPEVSS